MLRPLPLPVNSSRKEIAFLMTFKKAFGLLLVLIILAVGGVYLLMTERAEDDKMRSLYTAVEPLEREREALIEEKANLDTEYATKLRDYGTVEVMFEHLDAQIISDVWPVMAYTMNQLFCVNCALRTGNRQRSK